MRTTFALAAAAMLALAAPAFAQSAGSPGAASSGSGANTPGSGVDKSTAHGDMNGTVKGMKGNGNRMKEGRAASMKTNTPGDRANATPKTVKGDQNKQDTAK